MYLPSMARLSLLTVCFSCTMALGSGGETRTNLTRGDCEGTVGAMRVEVYRGDEDVAVADELDALYKLALCLLQLPAPDGHEIRTLLENASQAGNEKATFRLALIHLDAREWERAEFLLRLAFDQGSLMAGEYLAKETQGHRKAYESAMEFSRIRQAIATGRLDVLSAATAGIAEMNESSQAFSSQAMSSQTMFSQTLSALEYAILCDRESVGIWLLANGLGPGQGARRLLNLKQAIAAGMNDLAGILVLDVATDELNRSISGEDTALLLAVRRNARNLLPLLIRAGSDLSARGVDGRSVVNYLFDQDLLEMLASLSGQQRDAWEMERFIRMVDRNVSGQRQKPLLITAAEAGNLVVVRQLVAAGADPWVVESAALSAIETLYVRGEAAYARELSQYPASLFAADRMIRLSIESEDAETLNQLIEAYRYSSDAYAEIDQTPLWLAAESGNSIWQPLTAWQSVDERRDERGRNLLMHAIEAGNAGLASLLLRKGSPLDDTDILGRSAHWYAASNGMDNLLAELAILENLIDQADARGYTPLLSAVAAHHRTVSEKALLLGADVNKTTRAGNTALILAARNDPEMVRLLLDHHADVGVRNASSRTALMIAAGNDCEQCVQLLLGAGAKPARKDAQGHKAWDLASNPDVRRLLN